VAVFLTDLVTRCLVSSSTQNQALSANLFLYRDVLALELPWLDSFERSRKPRRLPEVLTPMVVLSIFEGESGWRLP